MGRSLFSMFHSINIYIYMKKIYNPDEQMNITFSTKMLHSPSVDAYTYIYYITIYNMYIYIFYDIVTYRKVFYFRVFSCDLNFHAWCCDSDDSILFLWCFLIWRTTFLDPYYLHLICCKTCRSCRLIEVSHHLISLRVSCGRSWACGPIVEFRR